MTEQPVHPLRKWRVEQGLTLDAAAAGVGTFRGTWFDWEVGRRIPDREYMQKVHRFTRGAVDANAFHWPNGLPDLGQGELPLPPSPAPLLDRIDDAQDEDAATEPLQDAA